MLIVSSSHLGRTLAISGASAAIATWRDGDDAEHDRCAGACSIPVLPK